MMEKSELDNFRRVYPYSDDENNKGLPGVIFRSAKVNVKEKRVIEELQKHGIKTIIDFGVSDVEKQCITTLEPVDEPVFSTQAVLLTSNERYKPGEHLNYRQTNHVMPATSSSKTLYSINIFSSFQMVWTAFKRVSWYYTVAGFFLVLLDLVLWTAHYKHFIRLCFHVEEIKGGLVQLYKDILDSGHKGVCAALKILSEKENYPVLISCAAGKDRTGLVTALTLHCLGKSEEYIINDYTKSEESIANMSEEAVFKKICKLVNFPKSFQGAKAEAMSETLQYLKDMYGSIDNYLEYIGFSKSDQQRLQQNVLSFSAE